MGAYARFRAREGLPQVMLPGLRTPVRLATRHADAEAAPTEPRPIRDRSRVSRDRGRGPAGGTAGAGLRGLPRRLRHVRLRTSGPARRRGARAIAARPFVERAAEDLLSALARKDEADLPGEFAHPLTTVVVREPVGFDDTHRDSAGPCTPPRTSRSPEPHRRRGRGGDRSPARRRPRSTGVRRRTGTSGHRTGVRPERRASGLRPRPPLLPGLRPRVPWRLRRPRPGARPAAGDRARRGPRDGSGTGRASASICCAPRRAARRCSRAVAGRVARARRCGSPFGAPRPAHSPHGDCRVRTDPGP